MSSKFLKLRRNLVKKLFIAPALIVAPTSLNSEIIIRKVTIDFGSLVSHSNINELSLQYLHVEKFIQLVNDFTRRGLLKQEPLQFNGTKATSITTFRSKKCFEHWQRELKAQNIFYTPHLMKKITTEQFYPSTILDDLIFHIS